MLQSVNQNVFKILGGSGPDTVNHNLSQLCLYLFFNIHLFIYLFILVVLGLRCSRRAP